MAVTLRPYMIAGDGPDWPREGEASARVIAYDVDGLPHGQTASLWGEHDTLWRIRRGEGGWTGEYASKEAALAALQA